MIYGLDFSGWTTVSDARAMFNDQRVIDFAFIRGWDGYKDDQKITEHKTLVKTAKGANGSILWSTYGFLGYSGSIGSRKWTAVRGDVQMENLYNQSIAGGREFQLPIAVDSERVRWWDGTAYQYVPLPSASVYIETYLRPAIEYLTGKLGRRPFFYSNADIILNYLAPELTKEINKPILECPLWVAGYTGNDIPPYWDRVSKLWPTWLAWQFKGDVSDWPGVDDVDLNRAPGTRAQWKAWANDPKAPIPSDGGVEPLPEPEPEPEPEPGDPDTAAALARIEAKLDKLAWLGK